MRRPLSLPLAGVALLSVVPTTGAAQQASAPTQLTWSVAGGLADLGRPSISRSTPAHLLLGVTVSRAGFPLEVRAEALGVQQAGLAGQWGLSANGVLPVGRVGLGTGALRPYAVGGANVATATAPVSRLSWNAGGGLRYEGARFGVFSEVRWQQAYVQTFGTFGFSLRR